MTEPPPRIPGTQGPLRTGPAGQTPDEAKFKRIAEVEESDETDSSKEGPAKNLFLAEEEEDQSEISSPKDPALFKSIISDQTTSSLPKRPIKGIKTEIGPTSSKKSPSPYLPPPSIKQVKEESESHLTIERSQKAAPTPSSPALTGKKSSPFKTPPASTYPTSKQAPSPSFQLKKEMPSPLLKEPSAVIKKESQDGSHRTVRPAPWMADTQKTPHAEADKALASPFHAMTEKQASSHKDSHSTRSETKDAKAHDKEKEQEISPAIMQPTASSAFPQDGMGMTPPPPVIEGSLSSLGPIGALSRLDPEVMALFQKMVGLMILDATKPGIVTSTTVLSMPGSVFDGASIVLTHYSTAPLAFNLQLLGSVDAVRLFEANQSSLAASFKQGQFDFSVHILKPALEAPQEDRKKQRVRRTMKKKATDNEEG